MTDKRLDQLLLQCKAKVWHKDVLWRLARILHEKQETQTAINLGLITMEPLPLERLQELWLAKEERKAVGRLPQPVEPIIPQTRLLLLRDIQGSRVPGQFAVWLFDLSFELSTRLGTPELSNRVIDGVMEFCEDSRELKSLMSRLKDLREFDSMRKVGFIFKGFF